ncbi:MAG: discoidin domain-containing protein, partial [Phycisphaerales bacterium]
MGKIKSFAMLVLMLSVANAWGAAFLDDFNRPDGEVGNGWSILEDGTIEVKIVNNEVLITGQQGIDWERSGIERDIVGETKVSCDFKAGEGLNFHIRVTDTDTSAYLEIYTWGGPLIHANAPDGSWPGWTDIAGSDIVAGEYNTVVLELVGAEFTVTLNDTVVITLPNASFTSIGRVLISSDAAAGTTGSLHIDNVEIGEFVGGVAKDPSPAHQESDVPREVVLAWTPGEFAQAVNGHIVYLSENFSDVNDGLGGITQSASSYAPPQHLDFETTYYWRVDEVNAPPDSTVFKGDIWSFTTEPVAYPVDGANITATASSSGQADSGPENTINGSGLDADDLHSTSATDMWLSDSEPLGAWIQYEFDKVYRLHEMWVWNSNQVFEPLFGFGLKDVTVEYSTNGTDWTALADVTEFARAPGTAGYAHDTTVDFGGVTAKYVKLTVANNWGGVLPQYSLSEVRFFYIPVVAREPSPDSGATDVDVDATLSWRAGRDAATHDVYLSTDVQAVIDGNAPATSLIEASYGPVTLDLGKMYFWRVDEVNDAETPAAWQGEVWNFKTIQSIVVDDFEDYNDWPPYEIYTTWQDGYENPLNGSQVGNLTPPLVETTIVHGGYQSMPLFYSNTGGATYSEAERTFAVPQDWTKHGTQRLVLYLHGTEGNTGQLYVKINGAKVPYSDDAADIAQAQWKPWNIDLASLGVNLQSVTSLAIGIDGNGAGGTLYIDDIGLYPPSAPLAEVWLEAEAAGTLGASWRSYDDPNASGGKGIGSEVGDGQDYDYAPGAEWTATYSFTAPAGEYKILLRGQETGNDSFWVRIPTAIAQTHEDPDQPGTGWVRFNELDAPSGWAWDEVHSNDHGNAVVTWILPAGEHTLEIAKREE